MADETPKTAEDLEHPKRQTAFYTSLVNAWIATRMERDKSLVTASIGLLGASIALIGKGDLAESEMWWMVGASVSFFTTLVGLLKVLGKNARLLEEQIGVVQGVKNDERVDKLSRKLNRLDRRNRLTLYFGLAIALLVAVSVGLRKSKDVEHGRKQGQEHRQRTPDQEHRGCPENCTHQDPGR